MRIPKLTLHVRAVAQVLLLGIHSVAITQALVEAATLASQQFELLPATPWLSRSCKPMVLLTSPVMMPTSTG